MKLFRATDFFWFPLFIFAAASALYFGAAESLGWVDVQELRLPRAVLAFAVGAALSLAGAVLQAFFKNPLCEPYTLGVSSGAALGAVIGSTLGIQQLFFGFSPLALVGALLFSGLLLFVSRAHRLPSSTLLLVGVMLGFLGSSAVAVWMALSDPAGIQAAIGWLLGDLSRAELKNALFTTGAVGVIFFFLYRDHRSYDALLLGEEEAVAVGVNLSRLRIHAILWTSLLVSLAVSVSGMIGFVGLLVPQFIRRSGSARHSRVLPLCAFAGGTVVVLADTLARTVFAPYELPVGVVTAVIGAPFFILILLRFDRGSS